MISNQPQSDRPEESREQRPSSSVGEAGGRMKEHMRSVAEDAREKGRSVVDRQKHQVADTLRHVSEALNRAAQKLHEEKDENVANFTDAVCERVENVAEYVDRVEVSDMIDQVENFARRQPQVFLGGMFLVGLAAARFLKASPPSQGHRQGQMRSGSMQHHGVTGTRGATPGLRGGIEHSPSSPGSPGTTGGGMQGASTRQQGIGGPGQSGPSVTPPTGATFPSSSEPIPGPRPAESSRGESGIGGSSRSQESRSGSPSGSTSPQREKQHQSEQQKPHEGRGGDS